MRCLVCQATGLSPLYEDVRDHYGVVAEPYRFLRCEACGSATLDPLPGPVTVARLYSPDYTFKPAEADASALRRAWGALEWRLFYRPAYRRRLAILRRLTGLAAGRLLEVGCGSGLFLRFLRSAGYEVEGIETSRTDVEYARSRFGLPVHHGALDTLDLPAGGYDAVLLLYVLEHLPDPARALARIVALLRPGGWVVLGLPVVDSRQARLLGARWSAVTEAPRHVSLPSFAGALQLLAGAGFRDVRVAPSPLLENAGHVALSLLPAAASPRAGGRRATLAGLLRRGAGAVLMLPALLVAAAERLPGPGGGRAGTMIFCGRR